VPTIAGSVVTGPDGNVWFTEPGSSKIGKLVVSTVPSDNLLTLGQASLTFTAVALGSPPAPQTFVVTSAAVAPFTVTTGTPLSPWLSVSPSGSLVTNQTLSVTVNQALLGANYGTFWTYILLTSGNVTQTVPVTLNLTRPTVGGGDIKVQPTSLSFDYTTPQGSARLPQQLVILNVNPLAGSIPLTISYSISSPAGGTWLTLTTAGGNPIPNASSLTSGIAPLVHVDAAGLSPGVYNASITISPTGGARVTVPVTLTVIANPNPTTIAVDPITLTFVWRSGSISPSAQFVQVTESGPQLPFLAQSDSPSWLSVTPVAGDPPARLSISAGGVGQMAAGNYTGTITITLPRLPGVSAKINVLLTVLPAESMIQEYAVPTANSQPLCIAAGPDGNLWFTESAANKIGKVTPAGVVTEYSLSPNSVPSGITAGPDGNLWFTELQANRIGRITTAGAVTEFALSPSAVPRQIALGPDGNLWFTEDAGNKIGRITTAGAITEYAVPTALAGLGSIVLGPDAALWFTERNLNRIGRITTSGSVQEYPISGMVGPVAIALGFDGNLWVTATDAIWKVTPTGAATPFFLPNANSYPQGIAAGPDGNAWFTEASGNRIARLTPSGVLTEFPLPAAGSGPDYVAMGRDGNMWFTESAGNRIGKLAMSVVPAADLLSLSSTSLTFTGRTSGSPATPQTLAVFGVPKSFTASAKVAVSAPWLSISPSGNLTTSQNITVSANPAALATPGTYVGNILLNSGDVTQTVLVTFNVTAASAGGNVWVSPPSFHFSPAFSAGGLGVGGATPETGPIPVTISSTVSSPAGGKWLILETTSGIVPASTGGNTTTLGIPVRVDFTGLAAGSYEASITVAPTGGAPVIVPVTLMVPPPSSVVITAVANAASFSAGAVAPGEIVTISGNGLGPVSPLGLALDPSGKVATWLGGVSVSFNGYLAPLIYAGATQINCVVPYEIDGATDVLVQVNYSGQSATFALKATAMMPGIFTLNGSGTGAVAAANSSGGYNGLDNPAPRGSTITFYLTGEGQTKPKGVTGKVTSVDASSAGPLTPQPLLTPSVMIGGLPATITFYGEAPDMVAGVMQLNVQIPVGLPSVSLPLIVSFGSVPSQNGVTVSVQ
jgi:uncharacterized protein (TIGR03437 family)